MTPERFAKGMAFDDYVKVTGSPKNMRADLLRSPGTLGKYFSSVLLPSELSDGFLQRRSGDVLRRSAPSPHRPSEIPGCGRPGPPEHRDRDRRPGDPAISSVAGREGRQVQPLWLRRGGTGQWPCRSVGPLGGQDEVPGKGAGLVRRLPPSRRVYLDRRPDRLPAVALPVLGHLVCRRPRPPPRRRSDLRRSPPGTGLALSGESRSSTGPAEPSCRRASA